MLKKFASLIVENTHLQGHLTPLLKGLPQNTVLKEALLKARIAAAAKEKPGLRGVLVPLLRDAALPKPPALPQACQAPVTRQVPVTRQA